MGAIFISYRREDSEGHAGRLFEDLVERFGAESVFMDVAGIEPGRDFRKVIDANVANCSVLLAVIGKRWLDAKDEAGKRRIDDPADFVRLETSSALKRDIPVVPVLVQGASMPRAEQLPAELSELAFRNAVELRHARWGSDVDVLAKALQPYMPKARPPVSSPAGAPPRELAIATPPPVVDRTTGSSSHGKLIVGAVIVALLGLGGGYFVFRDDGGPEQTTQVVAGSVDAERTAAAAAEAERQAEAQRKAEDERRTQAEQLARQQAAEELAAKEKALEAERLRFEEERAKSAEDERRKAEAARLAEEDRKKAEAARRADEERKKVEAARLAEEERKKAEAARLADEERKKAEAARLAEEERKKAEAVRAGAHPSGLRSIPGTPATTITFSNVGERTVGVYWITFEGKEQLYFKLAPGQSYDQATGVNHAWIVRDSATQRQVATAVGAAAPITVRIGTETKPTTSSSASADAHSVKRVAFSDGSGKPTGYFRFAGSGNWVETGPAGNDIRFKFQERGRDDSSIYLVDRSREVAIQLDLAKRVVMYQDGKTGKRWALYEIVGVN